MKKCITKMSLILPFMFTLIGCGGSGSAGCTIPESPSYKRDIASLIEKNCFSCHGPDVYRKKASRNKIFDYENLKKKALSGILIGSVDHQKGYIAMPYKKGIKIPECDIEMLKVWVDKGCKE